MKAILILDAPSCCELCYLNKQREKGRYCVITKTYDKNYGNVKENCPLKPLPKKKDINFAEKKGNHYEMYTKNYVQGWNDFRDEILGEEE